MTPSIRDVRLPQQPALPGDFLVMGRDAPGVGDALDKLASAHWDYIDHFVSRLVARGPILSANGEEHTGSVHIITAASAPEAQRFADEEPYRRAHLYSDVTVTRFKNLLGQTMWERAPATPPKFSTFLLADLPVSSCSAQQFERLQTAAASNTSWVFLGLLLSPDGSCTGIAAAVDLKPEAAENALRELLERGELHAVSIELSRWQRGGRQQ
jgi:uncharacterized protein YciI